MVPLATSPRQVSKSVLESFSHDRYRSLMFDEPSLQRVTDEELEALLAKIIRMGGAASRVGDLYLATLSAEHIASRLALEGLYVMRRRSGAERTGW